ncbi:MAG: lytic transglycosylase domain-containing protein, partial [Sphingomicrobium sp.]
GNDQLARQLAARPHNFAYRPEDPERFYEMLLALAQGAAADRQYVTAFHIARQVDDAFPAGTDIGLKSLGIRDDYTSLTWLAGTMALDRIARPADAIVMFDRYSRGGRSLQVQSKGLYWAGRAALAAARPTVAATYFQRAAAYPELFYGQLALERMGRAVPRPAPVVMAATNAQRSEFMNRSLIQATRSMLAYGTFADRELFIRAMGESLSTDTERALAVELAQQMGRQNVPVWVARTARLKGSAYYVDPAFPRVAGNFGSVWSLSHGVARQESSFDKGAISHAGARGMMQLMLPTAREQAGKIGVPFDGSRLLSDSAYNMQIGSAYFRWLLSYWDGNVPLAVASYNAGIGNVRKWVNAYGDPRAGVDVLKWIEAIPFTETRGYVQRVIENSVVYDSINPAPSASPVHVSRYLGKSRPG